MLCPVGSWLSPAQLQPHGFLGHSRAGGWGWDEEAPARLPASVSSPSPPTHVFGLDAGQLNSAPALVRVFFLLSLSALSQLPRTERGDEKRWRDVGVQLILLVDPLLLDAVPAFLLGDAQRAGDVVPEIQPLLLGEVGDGLVVVLHLHLALAQEEVSLHGLAVQLQGSLAVSQCLVVLLHLQVAEGSVGVVDGHQGVAVLQDETHAVASDSNRLLLQLLGWTGDKLGPLPKGLPVSQPRRGGQPPWTRRWSPPPQGVSAPPSPARGCSGVGGDSPKVGAPWQRVGTGGSSSEPGGGTDWAGGMAKPGGALASPGLGQRGGQAQRGHPCPGVCPGPGGWGV
uniref:Uncharacterized protein n=1 Tax=Strix occidentalis caurina TaxID=311401 RepID=A0A8D0FEI4_STROC